MSDHLQCHGGAVAKNLLASAGDTRVAGSISGSGRSPRVGNGNPLQYSCLENSMDRVLPKPGPSARYWITNSQETRVGRKGKVALFWKPATRGEGGLESKNQLPMAAQETEVFKGELQGCLDGGRGQDDIVSSDSHLDLRDVAVHSASSWLFWIQSISSLSIWSCILGTVLGGGAAYVKAFVWSSCNHPLFT